MAKKTPSKPALKGQPARKTAKQKPAKKKAKKGRVQTEREIAAANRRFNDRLKKSKARVSAGLDRAQAQAQATVDESRKQIEQLAASTMSAVNLNASISSKPKRKHWWTRFKSAITGFFVSPAEAKADPDHTTGTRIQKH